MYKLGLLGNTERNLQFFSIYFHNIEMFTNKIVKYWKNPVPVFTELPCDVGDNDEGEGVEVDGSNKDVGLDNVNAGDGENKVDLGDVYNGGGNSNDDVEVDDVVRVNTNGVDDADFVNGDSKFECHANRSSGDGDDEDDGVVDDDGDAKSDIGNDANCGDGRSKIDCSKEISVDDGNSKSDGGGDTDDDGKGGDDSDGESNDGADRHKNCGDDDEGCLNSVKIRFKNKQIVLENFSLPDSARWSKSL